MTDALINTMLGSKRKTHEFTILELIRRDGGRILRPVTRIKRRWFPHPWERIVCTYGRYEIRDIDWEPELTIEECQAHIDGYKAVLAAKTASQIQSENPLVLSEQTI